MEGEKQLKGPWSRGAENERTRSLERAIDEFYGLIELEIEQGHDPSYAYTIDSQGNIREDRAAEDNPSTLFPTGIFPVARLEAGSAVKPRSKITPEHIRSAALEIKKRHTDVSFTFAEDPTRTKFSFAAHFYNPHNKRQNPWAQTEAPMTEEARAHASAREQEIELAEQKYQEMLMLKTMALRMINAPSEESAKVARGLFHEGLKNVGNFSHTFEFKGGNIMGNDVMDYPADGLLLVNSAIPSYMASGVSVGWRVEDLADAVRKILEDYPDVDIESEATPDRFRYSARLRETK